MSSPVAVDTQVIIRAYQKGDVGDIQDCRVCSVALAEYLMMQTDDYLFPAYYLLPRDRSIDRDPLHRERSLAWSQRHTDNIRIVLRDTALPVKIVYWGMSALADIVNCHDCARFQCAINPLKPRTRRRLLDKLHFVLLAEMSCDPLTEEDSNLGLELMRRFMRTNTPKEDVRNTANDMLILASAMNRGSVLRTDDTLLGGFAENQLHACAVPHSGNIIDLNLPRTVRLRKSAGTKGYVNHVKGGKAIS